MGSTAGAGAQDVVLYGTTQATIGWSAPSAGDIHGYAVYVSRNGGPEAIDQLVTDNRATLAGAPGDRVVARVRAFGQPDGGSPVVLSSYSPQSTAIEFRKAFTWQSDDLLALHCGSCAELEIRAASNPGLALRVSGLPAPWRLVGFGPVRSPGIDELWQNELTGTLVVGGLAQKFVVAGIGDVSGEDPPEAVGLVELDGDPTRELLLIDRDSGAVQIREFRNGAFERLPTFSAPPTWRFAGVADFDGDGLSELWWQRSPAGSLEVWRVDFSGLAGRTLYTDTGAAGDVVAIADIDGNGWPDPVWQTAQGALTVSYMDEGGLERNIALPAAPGDDRLDIRAVGSLLPGSTRQLLAQHRDTSAVVAIFPQAETTPLRAVLFNLDQPFELRLAH